MSNNNYVNFWEGSKEDYNNIAEKNKKSSTLYFIEEDGEIYKGSTLIASKNAIHADESDFANKANFANKLETYDKNIKGPNPEGVILEDKTFYTNWLTDNRLGLRVSNKVKNSETNVLENKDDTETFSPEVHHAYRLISPTLTKTTKEGEEIELSIEEALINVGDEYKPVYFKDGLPVQSPSPKVKVNLESEDAADIFNENATPGVSGILPVSHGGTGKDSFTEDSVLIGSETGIQSSDLKVHKNAGIATAELINAGNDSVEAKFTAENKNGKISLIASESRGLYDHAGDGSWIIERTEDGSKTKIPQWGSRGSDEKLVFFNSDGEPEESDATIGAASAPVYLSSGSVTEVEVIDVAHGGTGSNTFESNFVLVGDGQEAIKSSALEVNGYNATIDAAEGGTPRFKVKNPQGEVDFRIVTGSNGASSQGLYSGIKYYTTTTEGVETENKLEWIIHAIETIDKDTNKVTNATVRIPRWANTGAGDHLVYFGASGYPTASKVDVGSSSKPVYLKDGKITEVTDVSVRNITASGTLNVTGAAALKSTLGVTGATTLSNVLDVAGATTLDSTLGVTGATTLGGHVYLKGSHESASTSNTTQIVFGTKDNQHIALTANNNAFVINPTTTTTSEQVVFFLDEDKTSKIPGSLQLGKKLTIGDELVINTGITQSATKGIKWTAISSKNPYIGYATNQTDGTFIICSLLGTSHTDGLAIGGKSGNLLYKNQQVLDKSNYTDVTVTKTGGGASGSWGISVTGSAGSVAWGNITGKPSTYTPSSHTHSTIEINGISDSTKYGTQMGVVQASTGGPESGSWHNSIKILHNNSAGYYTQLAQNFTGTEGLWHRRMNNGTISAWKKLLDSSNYSSYALPLSGGTLTGTLNMNNNSITNIGDLSFNDPGKNEGVTWTGGNDWWIYESPDNLGNDKGNLQFVQGSTRRLTVRTDGRTEATGEIVSTSANAFRAIYGGYGFFIRNDGSNIYFMLTNSGDAYGNWNSLRPIIINNQVGSVSLGEDSIYVQPHSSKAVHFGGYGETTGITSSLVPNLRFGPHGQVYRSTHGNSSREIKENIKLIENEELKAENLYNLPVYQFNYKDNILSPEDCRYNKAMPGFIIEEMNEIYPIAVDKDLDSISRYWSWNSQYLIPPMLKLIQDQKKEITSLQNENQELKNSLNNILDRLSKLEEVNNVSN